MVPNMAWLKFWYWARGRMFDVVLGLRFIPISSARAVLSVEKPLVRCSRDVGDVVDRRRGGDRRVSA